MFEIYDCVKSSDRDAIIQRYSTRYILILLPYYVIQYIWKGIDHM